MTALTRV